MTTPSLPLFSWTPPQPKPSAPEGVKRAARAGSRVDAAVLAVARENVGRDMTEGDFWAHVTQRATCVPDTARRRRDALAAEGLLAYERPALGIVKVLWVRPDGGRP